MIERVLVADDEDLSREFIAEALESFDMEVTAVPNGEEALKKAETGDFDLVVTDMRMPRLDGHGLLKGLRKKGLEMPVVIVTAFGTIESAVEAMRFGADDFLLKPIAIDQLEIVLEKLKSRKHLEDENKYLRSQVRADAGDEMVCVSPIMRHLVETARQAANSKATVMVTGESGSGKEVLSRFIHQSSPRKDKPYIKVNCAALSENLLESELFGHEQGAFTSAVRKRKGRFELADGGTLLLDEISEITPSLQAKLLRVLEEEEFERVGGTRTIKVDVRVIATTNRNLIDEMDKGSFRSDLYYRLNVVPMNIPPLRDRREEIPVLAEHFLRRFARETGRNKTALSSTVIDRLCAYNWPGNVRELRNILQRAAILGGNQIFDEEQLANIVCFPVTERPAQGASPAIGKTLEEIEKEMILGTLDATNGSRKVTASTLGITTRTLTNKLNTYRIMGVSIPSGRGTSNKRVLSQAK